jgi:hypothetical protein
MPHNINQQMRQILSSITQPSVSNYLTTDKPDAHLGRGHGLHQPEIQAGD